MSAKLYDVIIIGSGPGGSSLAASLAKDGIEVLILEKDSLPRYKVCGGGVTKRAISKMPVDISSVIRDEINIFELSVDGKNSKEFKGKSSIVFSVMRDELDYLLADYAVKNGAELKTGTFVKRVEEFPDKVVVKSDHEEYHGKYVIGADGVNSLVAKQTGLLKQRRTAAAFECEIFTDTKTLEKYRHRIAIDYGIVPFGYAWIFPKGDHLSVGIGSYTFSHQQLTPYLQKYITRNDFQEKLYKMKGSFLSAGGIQEKVITERIALVGDAAGLVEPLGGEGIYYALWSSELLSKRLKETFLKREDAFGRYQSDVDEVILPEMQLIERIGDKFYRHTSHLHQLIMYFPFLVKAGFKVLEGSDSYMDFYQKINRLTKSANI